MELIPILSTIILVATISTFILAVGAYVLYKVRERKYQEAPQQVPEMHQAELVEPEDLKRDKIFVEDIVEPANRSVKPEVRYRPVNKVQSSYSPQYSARKERDRINKPSLEHKRVLEVPESRFLKYTDEGYVSTNEDREDGDIKWR